jgi:predicted RND superfamily exporter protein
VTRGSNLVLSDGGHAVVVIATVCLIAAWFVRRGFRWDLFFAVLCGISLGLSSGVAGVAGYVLSPVVSTAGDAIVGVL